MSNLNKILLGCVLGAIMAIGADKLNLYLMNSEQPEMFYLNYHEVMDIYSRDTWDQWRDLVDQSYPGAHFEITAGDKFRYGDGSTDTMFYALLVWEIDDYGNQSVEYAGSGDGPLEAIKDAICEVPSEFIFKPE